MKIYKLDKNIIKEIGEKSVENGTATDHSKAVNQMMYFWALTLGTEITENIYKQLPNIMQPMFRELTAEEIKESKLWVVEE